MTLTEIVGRTAARKAAGLIPVYAHGPAARPGPPARVPLPVSAPCVYEGAVIEPCYTCNKGGRDVRGCELHERCTRDHVSGKVRSCSRCDDHIPENAHPNIIAADAFARAIPPYPTGRYSGRGVVIVGGGRYWPSTYVTVRMLRHVGCALPIQVWYLGAAEADSRYADLLAPLGVELVDALAHPEAAKTRGLTGFADPTNRTGPTHPPFQAKSFAVLHSPFEEVLSLDADCYPCADPTALFDELRYLRTGAVFWPDRRETAAWTKWADWGVTECGPTVGLEVGQYLLDKSKVWAPLSLMRWYDDRGDWCYGWGHHHDHGDKGPPRVAFAKLKRDYAMYATEPRWERAAFVQPGPGGAAPMFCHRSQSKLVLEPSAFTSTPQLAPNMRLGLPLEDVAFGFLEGLRRALA